MLNLSNSVDTDYLYSLGLILPENIKKPSELVENIQLSRTFAQQVGRNLKEKKINSAEYDIAIDSLKSYRNTLKEMLKNTDFYS